MSTVILLQLLPVLLLLLLLLLLTLSCPDTMVSPLAPPGSNLTDRSSEDRGSYLLCSTARAEGEERIMGADMVEACVVVIRAQPAGRDVDKHVASPLPPAEPQMSRAAGERVVPVLTARSS